MSQRYVCIHGHFYQPPRENPWLEAVEQQDSAHPYHDWNERVSAECYAPNAASRILDAQGRITRIVNNYERISCNFGPTLLSWLEPNDPATYQAILAADQDSRGRFSGHGSAIAQAYNHSILPLCTRRDQVTQVRWGVRDFEWRFERKPEGMWLPETAVDVRTLEALAEHGILFTILAPHQAAAVRRKPDGPWEDVRGGRVDTRRAYECALPSGRRIALFFYDGPAARAVAFEDLLRSGDAFARRLTAAFPDADAGPQLSHIATDGETYGHHHRYGEMALAYALNQFEDGGPARLTNYAEFLERFPPQHEVQILEHTSWSCAHGVERWRSGCGCSTGGSPGWNQAWRGPLRQSIDWLRDQLAPLYEQKAAALLQDPWEARDGYIDVILDRSNASLERFFAAHARRALNEEETTDALRLLELQRHALLMQTSCGWFFDDIAGIEAVQVLRYAGRALHLAQDLFGDHLEDQFLARLEPARSNRPEEGGARDIWARHVQPARVDPPKLVAVYAMSALFDGYPETTRLHCYSIRREHYQHLEAGRAQLAVGVAATRSEITHGRARLGFAVVHMGDHTLTCGVKPVQSAAELQPIAREFVAAFDRADFPALVRALDARFGASVHTLASLFPDMRRKLLNRILAPTLEEAESRFRRVYEQHTPLMRYISGLGLPLPKVLQITAEFILNDNLQHAFVSRALDLEHIAGLLDDAREQHIPLDRAALGFVLARTLEHMASQLSHDAASTSVLHAMRALVAMAKEHALDLNLWKVQNRFYELSETVAPELRRKAEQGDAAAAAWLAEFSAFGTSLGLAVV
ncbi:MAG: DUF3536 domain-containing protein [Planctomycetota bacterium]|nr:MAG: DUF3536 domain-containing protein [Planctomycetota bacterium]